MERAEELQVDGEPWAAELVARYRLALARYCVKWGLRVESCRCPSTPLVAKRLVSA